MSESCSWINREARMQIRRSKSYTLLFAEHLIPSSSLSYTILSCQIETELWLMWLREKDNHFTVFWFPYNKIKEYNGLYSLQKSIYYYIFSVSKVFARILPLNCFITSLTRQCKPWVCIHRLTSRSTQNLDSSKSSSNWKRTGGGRGGGGWISH